MCDARQWLWMHGGYGMLVIFGSEIAGLLLWFFGCGILGTRGLRSIPGRVSAAIGFLLFLNAYLSGWLIIGGCR